MFNELMIKDKFVAKKELQDFFYNSARGGKIDNLCLQTSLIHYFSAIHGYVNIIGLIDYPFGLSCTKARVQDIDFAVKAGCKTVDVVLNHSYIINDDLDLIEKDMRQCQTKLLPNNLELRVIVDYRIIEDKLKDLCSILFPLGITSVITSTGVLSDDTSDNLLTANTLQKLHMDVISCGVCRSLDDYKLMQLQDIKGVRFTSINAAKNILGQLI